MNTEIRNSAGEKLDYSFHDAGSDIVVVIGHGVTGNKDRPLVVALAEGLAADGISALRFSFAGNGDSEGDFRDATITKEVGDLGAVLDAVEAAGKTAIYAGHSMGGAVGVTRTSTDDRIKALISLAGMVDCKKFCDTEFGDGADCMWEDEDCPLSDTYLNDMASIGTIVELGSSIHVPWLLVHGTEDDVVLIEDTHNIFEKANEPKQKLILDGCDHVFSEPEHSKQMVGGVVTWVKGVIGR